MNWAVMWRSLFDVTCSGGSSLFALFVLSVGVQREDMGYVVAAGSIACLLQALCLAMLNRVSNRKRYVIALGVVETVSFPLMVVLVPFLPQAMRLWVISAGVLMAAACVHLTRPLTDEWLASLIPPGLRSGFISRRFQIMNLGFIVGLIGVGLVDIFLGEKPALDLRQNLGDLSITWVLAAMLLIGAFCGLMSVILLSRAHMSHISLESTFRWRDLKIMLRVRPYIRFLVMIMLLNVPFALPMSYYAVFNLDEVGMPLWMATAMFLGYMIVKTLFLRPAGYLVGRFGPRRLMLSFVPAYILFFVVLVAAGPGRPWPVFVAWGICAAADGLWVVATQVALYGTVPERGARQAYFALYNIGAWTLLGVGGLVAVRVMHALKDVTLTIGPVTLTQFQILFASSAVLMIPACAAPLLLDRQNETSRRSPEPASDPSVSSGA